MSKNRDGRKDETPASRASQDQRTDDDLAADPIFQAGIRAAEKLPPMSARKRRVAAILRPALERVNAAQDEGDGAAAT